MELISTEEKFEDDLLENFRIISNDLKSIITDTENYYSIIYENLPIIEKNIELTVQETSILIDYFIDTAELNSESEVKKEKLISQALNKIKSNFKMISKILMNQEEADKILELFLKDNNKGVSFKSLIDLINETRTILEDINVISLNAIIFSSKLGVEGKAFGVVSDNIHQISSALEEEFANVEEILDTLLDWHNNLKKNIENIVLNQEEIIENYIINIDDIFNSVQVSIQMINDILSNLMNNVEDIVSPFQGLMVSIQGQDIIRQNLENINKSLRILENKYQEYLLAVENNEEQEVILNYIVFISKGLELIDKLAQRSFEELFRLVDDIVSDVNNLLKALTETKEDAANLTNYLYQEQADLENNDAGAIDLIFKDIFTFTDDFIITLKKINNSVVELNENKNLFSQRFNNLENTLDRVSREVSNLNKIEILARIELARMQKDNSGFGLQIEEVINNVNQKVDDNSQVFHNLKQDLGRDLEEFGELVLDNKEQINEAIIKTEVFLDELEITNDIINQAVAALYSEVENLNNEVIKINDKLQTAKDLKEKGINLLGFIEKLLVEVTNKEKMHLDKLEINEWQLKDNELQELVEQFTTYLERETAQEFLAEKELQEVDMGSAGGDLVLF